MSMSISVQRLRERVRAKAAEDLPPDMMVLSSERPVISRSEMAATVAEVFGMGPGTPCPLYAWVLRRESAYFAGPGHLWPFEIICYAACRDFLRHARRNQP
jgi:hypothetical protein